VRLLLITTHFPLPQDTGGVVRALGLSSWLARRHEVHVLAQERPSTEPQHVDELRARLGAPVDTFARAPEPSGSLAAVPGRWGRALVRRTPPWVLREHNAALEARALSLAPSFDAAVTLDDEALVYVPALATVVPTVIDKQNVMGWSLAERGAASKSVRARAQNLIGRSLMRRLERRTSDAAAAVVVTSGAECERHEQLYRYRPDAVVASAIDPPPPADRPLEGRAVAWLGDLRYYANAEGLVRFVREGWAPVAAAGGELLVVGRDGPPEVEALRDEPGVRLLGYVPDLEKALDGASAAVVPLWHGAGVKLKTLTLMVSGLPVVATPVAVEGIEVDSGRHCLVADDPKELGAHLKALFDDKARRRSLASAGRALVLEAHTWDAVGPSFEAILRDVSSA
jgi:polysaccharide biosynthesis protein PslH